MGRIRRAAAVAGLGITLLPRDGTEAWLAPNRRHAEVSGAFEAPQSMVETQWGSPYTYIPQVTVNEKAADFFFASVLESVAELPVEGQEGQEGGQGGVEAGEGAEAGQGGDAAAPQPKACEALNADADRSHVFQTIQGIETEEACQNFCGQTKGCVAAILEGSTCSLMRALRGVKDGSGILVVQTCDNSCFAQGRKLSSEGKSLGTANNANICQAMCQGEDGCIGFSWNRSSKECTSHPSEVGSAEDEASVSGPRDGCSLNVRPVDQAGKCTLQVDLTGDAGNHIEAPSVSTIEQCRRECLLDKDCKWFTFNEVTKICYHKKKVGNIAYGLKGDHTASRLCDASCLQKDVKFAGNAYKTLNVKYMQLCIYNCFIDSKCQRWSWDSKSTACNLFDGTGAADSSANQAGVWSGPKEGCGADTLYDREAPSCAVRGSRYGTIPISTQTADNATACQQQCQKSSMCEAFSYDIKGKVCYLHVAYAAKLKRVNYNFISGPRQCAGCSTKGSEYSGKALQEMGSEVETAEECQLLCQATSGCEVYSFLGSACKLLGSGETKKNVLATSGVKYCTGVCDILGFRAPRREFGYALLLKNKSLDQCRKACAADKKCTNFTSWLNGDCYVKDDQDHRMQEPLPEATTGWLSCSTCFRQGVGYKATEANLLWTLPTENAEECRQRCEAMESCGRFSYDAASKACSMLSGEGEDVEGENLVSGPPRCTRRDTCYQDGVSFTGGKAISEAEAASSQACQALCEKDAKCRFFTLASGKCSLFADDAALRPTKSDGAVSGNKRCILLEDICEEANIQYSPGDLYDSPLTAKNAQECTALCYKDPQCRIWTFLVPEKQCFLKSINGFSNRAKATSEKTSGGRLGCARCTRSAIAFGGKELQTVSGLPHETVCQFACELNKQCKFFTFDQSSKSCKLFASDSERLQAENTVLSGPRRC